MTITLSQVYQGAAAAVPLPVSQGGTAATSAAAALVALGAQPSGNYATGDGTATGTNTGDQDLKDWWEFSTQVERVNPQVQEMGAALGVTDRYLDDLWTSAGTL